MTDDRSPPPARRPCYLTLVGDPNDPGVWSGTAYHTLAEGKRQGVIDAGLALDATAGWVKPYRIGWNLLRAATGRGRGGFQYSEAFLERLWAAKRPAVRGARVINHFQLYPRSVLADDSVERWHYLDGTCRQLIEYYQEHMEPRQAAELFEREGESYRAAAGVMTMSRFAADSVIRDYGVDPRRVHVVVPGANLTREVFDAFEREAAAWRDPATGRPTDRPSDDPPRLVFVGRAAVRKGLDRLLGALRIARGRGSRATLRVIGVTAADAPAALRDVPGVEWLGLVSRRTDALRFCRLVAECDVGCLLSRQEMAGISLREFVALGLPVIGPLTGGSPDQMSPGSSVGIAPDVPDDQLADVLMSLETDRPAWERRRAAAWAARQSVLWEPSIKRMGAVLATVR